MSYHFTLENKKIWVAGCGGMVGAAIIRALKKRGVSEGNILRAPSAELDLRDQRAVNNWIAAHKPDAIILAAAKVGGILANRDYPADFLYDNLMIESNIIHAAHVNEIQKLVFLGSSCIYPKHAPQPLTPDSLLTSPLEPTNEAYAIAKIAGIKLCQTYRAQYKCDFIAVMPCNLYGLGDRYDAENSHVIPAMIMKFREALQNNKQEITFWGTGSPLREFLYVDDCAAGILHALEYYSGPAPLNLGSGAEISIKRLAETIADITGYKGRITFDSTYPDGTPRKIMDSAPINALGWTPKTPLSEGLQNSYDDFLEQNS